MIAPLQYKKKRKRAAPKTTGRLPKPTVKETLTGMVQGKKASDIEERFSRALDKKGIEYTFQQHYFGPARDTPGAIEIDFMIMDGMWRPVQIDGEIGHKTAQQRAEDRIKDARLNAYFQRVGLAPVLRIPDNIRYFFGALDTQESTDRIVRELF